MSFTKDQVEIIKVTKTELTRNSVTYTARLYTDNARSDVKEKLFFDRDTDLYSVFQYKNIERLKEIILLWGKESKYLNESNVIYLLFSIYKYTTLDIFEINRFFIDKINNE